MDIQAEKLNLIEELIQLNDKSILKKIKSLLSLASKKIKPMTIEEFYAKIEASEKDIEAGNLLTHDELIKEATDWKK